MIHKMGKLRGASGEFIGNDKVVGGLPWSHHLDHCTFKILKQPCNNFLAAP